jgi:hypothetical protein
MRRNAIFFKNVHVQQLVVEWQTLTAIAVVRLPQFKDDNEIDD